MADNYSNQQELIAKLLTEILNKIGLGGAAPLLPLLGLNGNAGSNIIWPTGGATPGSAAMSRFYDNIDAGYRYQRDSFSTAAQNHMISAFYRSIGKSGAELDAAVNDVNGLVRMGLDLWDPMGSQSGLRGAQQLARMTQRSYAGVDFGKTRELTDFYNNLYSAQPGGLLWDTITNPGEFKNFSSAQVMSIGQEVMMSNGADSFMKNGKFDASKFRQKVKDMTAMVEPWKDVFGEDIPKLMQAFEALSDQSMNLNTMTTRTAGFRVSSVLDVTGGNVQQLAAYKDQFSKVLQNSNGYGHPILSSLATAEAMMLGTANGGVNTMTTQEFQQNAALFYAGSARGGFAASYAQAISAYAAQNGIKDYEEAKRTFETEYTRRGANGYATLTDITGLTKSGLTQYARTDIALAAEKEGLGALQNRKTILSNVARETLSGFAATGVNQDVVDALRQYKGGLGQLLGQSQDQIADYLGNLYDKNGELIFKTRAEAVESANRLQQIGARRLSVATNGAKSTAEQLQETFNVGNRELDKEARVNEIARFKNIASNLSTGSGFREFINKLGTGAPVKKLLGAALGANNYLASISDRFDETFYNSLSDDEKASYLQQFSDEVAFFSSNASALNDTKSAASAVYDVLNNPNSSHDMKEAAKKKLSLLKNLDAGAVAELSEERYQKLNRQFGSNLTTQIIADDIADSRITRALGKSMDPGIQEFLTKTTVTSKSELEKALENSGLKDNQKDALRSAANKAFPSIDGNQPIDEILTAVNKISIFFSETVPKILNKLGIN